MERETEPRRVYAPGEVAGRLGVSGQRLRQLAAVYEGVRGELPRDQRGRVWPEGAVEDLQRAHAAVVDGRAASVEQALRDPEGADAGAGGVEARRASSGPSSGDIAALAGLLEGVLEEMRGLRGAVEEQNRRIGTLERENRELREEIREADGRELEAPAGPGAVSGEAPRPDEGLPPPWSPLQWIKRELGRRLARGLGGGRG